MTPASIYEFFKRLQAQNPHPKSDLEYTNPFTLLVAVVLSAQATDKGVNKATHTLFKKYDTPQKMLKLGEAGLIEHIKTIGLFRAKAKNVIKLCEILVAEYEDAIPRTQEDLIKLPGVGQKTANVVRNIVYGDPSIAVDTHVFRVGNRTKMATGKTPDEVEKKLLKKVPKEFLQHAHHWLILHGRYVCKARNPLCGTCIVRDLCPVGKKLKV